jgi:hypothetical protein
MLKSSDAALLKNRIATTVKKLSTYKGNLPDTNSAQEVAAGEMFLAMEVKRNADSMLNAARNKCILEGVTFDTAKSELKGKDSIQLFDGEHIAVYVNVSEGPIVYPWLAVRSELIKHGLSSKDIDKIAKAAGKKNANAHKFSAVLKMASAVEPKVTVDTTTDK